MDEKLIADLIRAVEAIEEDKVLMQYHQVAHQFDPPTIRVPTALWHNLVVAISAIQRAKDEQ